MKSLCASKAVNFILFQAAWFALTLGAAKGYVVSGMLAAVAVAAFHVAFGTAERGRTIALLLLVTAIGFVLDSLHMWMGIFRTVEYPAGWPYCPPWLALLWLVFATMLRSSLSWLSGRYATASVLGAIGGPLSYWAGIRMGAASLDRLPLEVTLLALSVSWALVTPLMFWMAERLHPTVA